MELKYKPTVYGGGEDTYMLQRHVAKLSKGKFVLDMGCGNGIQAITAALNGAKHVVAADINPDALALTKQNAKLNHVSIDMRESDLFSNLPERFDLIIFNAPYLPMNAELKMAAFYHFNVDNVMWSGGAKLITKFLNEAKKHLNKNGKILLVYSSATKLRYKGIKIIDKMHFMFEEIYVGLVQV